MDDVQARAKHYSPDDKMIKVVKTTKMTYTTNAHTWDAQEAEKLWIQERQILKNVMESSSSQYAE